MKIVDLTRPIIHGSPTYPGDECGVNIKQNKESNMSSNIVVSKFSLLDMHYGTHVDMPLHFFSNGIDAASCICLAGRAVIIKKKDHVISFSDFELSQIKADDIVLIHTGWDIQPPTSYYINYPYISEESAKFLVKKNISSIGIDTPNPDKHDSTDFPVHKILLKANIPIIEGLAHLDKLIDSKKRIWFFAAPLNICDAEASPIRAIALVYDNNESTSIDTVRTMFIR